MPHSPAYGGSRHRPRAADPVTTMHAGEPCRRDRPVVERRSRPLAARRTTSIRSTSRATAWSRPIGGRRVRPTHRQVTRRTGADHRAAVAVPLPGAGRRDRPGSRRLLVGRLAPRRRRHDRRAVRGRRHRSPDPPSRRRPGAIPHRGRTGTAHLAGAADRRVGVAVGAVPDPDGHGRRVRRRHDLRRRVGSVPRSPSSPCST